MQKSTFLKQHKNTHTRSSPKRKSPPYIMHYPSCKQLKQYTFPEKKQVTPPTPENSKIRIIMPNTKIIYLHVIIGEKIAIRMSQQCVTEGDKLIGVNALG